MQPFEVREGGDSQIRKHASTEAEARYRRRMGGTEGTAAGEQRRGGVSEERARERIRGTGA